MDPKQQQQIKQYLNILLRWKKLILGCFLASLAVGLGLYVKAPKIYRAEALLVYQRGKINPTNEHSPNISEKVSEVLTTLKDQVLSRSSLEEIIKENQLYQESLAQQPMEDVIGAMRTHIEIVQSKGGDTFKVAFEGKTPRKVMLVTNALASKFVEENLRFREEKATETSNYIKDELAMTQKTLEKKEAAMRDYKLKYYNEMPEQRQTNIDRLNALQTNYQNIQNSLQELERTKIMVQEQISIRQEALAQAREGNIADTGQTASIENLGAFQGEQRTEDQLRAARAQLSALEVRYTDQHPEVKRLKKVITQLEEQLKSSASSSMGQKNKEGQAREAGLPADKQLLQLELQIKDIGLSMGQLKKEKEQTKQQIELYQQWIAAAPTREAEWAGITRDYEQLKERYQRLVASDLSAASVETLERKQKGSQFKVLDPGHLPEKPYSPDPKKFLLISLLAGFGLGCSIALGVEFIDSSFKEAHDLENYLNLPIVCSIPIVQLPSEKKKLFLWNIFWSLCFVTALLSLIAGSIYLWNKGILII